MTATLDDEVADLRRANGELQRRLDERTAERDAALARETAVAGVLQVVSSSAGDLAPVFQAILDNALRLCGAAYGNLLIYENGYYHAIVGVYSDARSGEQELARAPFQPTQVSFLHRITNGESIIYVEDVRLEAAYHTPQFRELMDAGGYRSMFYIALRQEDRLLGAIVIFFTEITRITGKQIELLQNFAAQAVIAMENARLITETREALDQQTATAEVLQVINASPGDLAPVFDAMLEKAMRLCEAPLGALFRYDGLSMHLAASQGFPNAAELAFQVWVPPAGAMSHEIVQGAERVHVADVSDTEAFRNGVASVVTMVKVTNIRTGLWVALRKEDALVGMFVLYRTEVKPFSDKQIALLENFAAQAVIAIENARLLGELRERTTDLQESLEYQTATSDVLKVISASTFDIQPVLDTLAETAARLCDAGYTAIYRRDGEAYRMAAVVAFSPETMEAALKFQAVLEQHPLVPGRGSIVGQVALEGRAVHVADTASDPEYIVGVARTLGNMRTVLGVPLLREGEPIGVIILARHRVQPFTDRQIELVRTFADQAVIAIENARLITETREALEQQTATAEVLQVINSSPGDLSPVFEAILDKAHSLCGATLGTLFLFDGETFRGAAIHGYPEELVDHLRRGVSGFQPAFAPLLAGVRLIHIPDLSQIDEPMARLVSGRGGVRTNLLLPLRKDGALLGMISCNRQEVRPFSDKEIALLENFAAQAVIAIENARLLDEIRQRQAELRVTFDNMADGVVMFDEDLRLAAWNRNFQELLDLPDAALAERPSYADYLRILAERGEFGSDDIEAELSRRLEETDQELRLERTRPDGRVIEVRRNSVPDGGFVLIYSDITERKRAEAEISSARDAAEVAYRDLKAAQANLVQAEKMASLGQLTAGIAHEIKNPLNFVNNFATLSVELLDELKETTAPAISALSDDKRAEVDETMVMLTGNLEKIAEHGRRADNIVKSMLEHSRGVTGERREVNLNGLVEEALNLAYHGARAQDQSFNITLERDYASSLTPIEVAPQEITRVFLNLFGNGFYAANKRSHDDGDGSFRPTLKVSTCDLGDAVEMRVRDNGTGIPPEIKDKLFQPFFTTKPTGEGTGLGLSISYDIVTAQHGGTITVDSRVGEYTEFTIRLPPRVPNDDSRGRCMSVSILVVDDEPDVADLFRQRFRREARQGTYVMHFAASGEQALSLLSGGIEPQLIVILSDINMPGMDGLTLLHEIKQRFPDLPVMMVTAYGDEERRRRATEYGASEFITKPVDFDILKEQLRQLSASAD